VLEVRNRQTETPHPYFKEHGPSQMMPSWHCSPSSPGARIQPRAQRWASSGRVSCLLAHWPGDLMQRWKGGGRHCGRPVAVRANLRHCVSAAPLCVQRQNILIDVQSVMAQLLSCESEGVNLWQLSTKSYPHHRASHGLKPPSYHVLTDEKPVGTCVKGVFALLAGDDCHPVATW